MPSPLPIRTSTSPRGLLTSKSALPLPCQVRDRQAIGLEADVDLRRRQEAPLAVAPVDEESVGGEDGQSAQAVAVEVDGADHQPGGRRRDDRSGWRGRPSPRPESRPKVFEPGLSATSEGRPPGVNIPTATLVVPSRLETGDGSAVPVTPYGPGPAR